jgi:hypothetical protein
MICPTVVPVLVAKSPGAMKARSSPSVATTSPMVFSAAACSMAAMEETFGTASSGGSKTTLKFIYKLCHKASI